MLKKYRNKQPLAKASYAKQGQQQASARCPPATNAPESLSAATPAIFSTACHLQQTAQ